MCNICVWFIVWVEYVTTEQKATWWTANIAQIVGSSIGLFMPNNQVDIFTAVCSSMYDELMKDTSMNLTMIGYLDIWAIMPIHKKSRWMMN